MEFIIKYLTYLWVFSLQCWIRIRNWNQWIRVRNTRRKAIFSMILNIREASELWLTSLTLSYSMVVTVSLQSFKNECLRNTRILFHILLVVNCEFNTENETECFQSNWITFCAASQKRKAKERKPSCRRSFVLNNVKEKVCRSAGTTYYYSLLWNDDRAGFILLLKYSYTAGYDKFNPAFYSVFVGAGGVADWKLLQN